MTKTNTSSKTRNGFIHLYNPQEEGLGLYDIHYINAYKKRKEIESIIKNQTTKKQAA